MGDSKQTTSKSIEDTLLSIYIKTSNFSIKEQKYKWYMRYFIYAPLLILFSWDVDKVNTDKAVLFGLNTFEIWMGILIACITWELVVAAVVLGVIYWLGTLIFGGIAALPVSVAVIIGAIIIALAVRK